MLKYINMKSYESIVFRDFVNVNVALNSQTYEDS